jgi:hypothetical protein
LLLGNNRFLLKVPECSTSFSGREERANADIWARSEGRWWISDGRVEGIRSV